MAALARANEVRLARAALKRRIAEGGQSVTSVILDPPWEAENMPVADLLSAQVRWGVTRSRTLLAGVPLGEKKTLGAMTDRQRLVLAALLVRP